MDMNKPHIFSDMSEDTRKDQCALRLLVADFFSFYLFCRKRRLDIRENFSNNNGSKAPQQAIQGNFMCVHERFFQNSLLDVFPSGSRYLLFLRQVQLLLPVFPSNLYLCCLHLLAGCLPQLLASILVQCQLLLLLGCRAQPVSPVYVPLSARCTMLMSLWSQEFAVQVPALRQDY